MKRSVFSQAGHGKRTVGAHGAWIFLTHSNKDFEKVSEVRNLKTRDTE